MDTIKFTNKLWQWKGQGAWHFISVPEEYYDMLHSIGLSGGRGFGSVKVEASIGGSVWHTSVFPDSHSRTFLLPVKKSVRAAEGIHTNEMYKVTLKIVN